MFAGLVALLRNRRHGELSNGSIGGGRCPQPIAGCGGGGDFVRGHVPATGCVAAAAPGVLYVDDSIYKPDQGTGVTPGDADATFNIPSGVQLKGGYAGIGTPDPDARDIAQYESILSGDLLGNDVVTSNPQNWLNYNENSLHVATVLNGSPLTGLEGLVFTSSRMDFIGENFGGGLSVLGGSVQIIQCEFRHCRVSRRRFRTQELRCDRQGLLHS